MTGVERPLGSLPGEQRPPTPTSPGDVNWAFDFHAKSTQKESPGLPEALGIQFGISVRGALLDSRNLARGLKERRPRHPEFETTTERFHRQAAAEREIALQLFGGPAASSKPDHPDFVRHGPWSPQGTTTRNWFKNQDQRQDQEADASRPQTTVASTGRPIICSDSHTRSRPMHPDLAPRQWSLSGQMSTTSQARHTKADLDRTAQWQHSRKALTSSSWRSRSSPSLAHASVSFAPEALERHLRDDIPQVPADSNKFVSRIWDRNKNGGFFNGQPFAAPKIIDPGVTWS